jgi:hypothetical protein
MSAWSGVLALTLVIRDEEDILGANLDYHLAQGVDVILAIDHGSSDRTPEILREYEQTGRVRIFRDEDRPHDQVQRVNRLLRIAAEEHRADWVIHCDADEFWVPVAGCLRDVFAAVPERFGYLVVERNNFLPMEREDAPFHQRLVVRERRSLTLRGTVLEPKVAQRPAAATAVAPGNHSLEAPVMDQAPDIGAVEVCHYPIRTFEQFERKVLSVGIGYEQLQDRAPGTGQDQLALLEKHRQGTLRAYHDAQCLDAGRIAEGLTAGDLVEDRRVQAFLAAGPARANESPEVQRVLRRAWLSAGGLEDALSAAHERIAELSAQLALAREEEAEVRRTLETIRRSRIMRMSEPARRLYYRVRPGG